MEHLEQHELFASKASRPKATRLELPSLQGQDLDEHFWTIGRRAAQPWLSYAESFAQATIASPPVPRVEEDDKDAWTPDSWLVLDETLRKDEPIRPATFSMQPGWTKYPFMRTHDGGIAGLGQPESVPYPDVNDKALVFDVEVMIQESHFPVMATAVSENAWYSWVSPWLLQRGERCESKAHLIPLGPRDGTAPPRLVIGHHAGFDRAAVLDEYTLESTMIRWLDTMSLHVATSGISSPQRAAWAEHSKARLAKKLNKAMATQHVENQTRAQIRKLLQTSEFDENELSQLSVDNLGNLQEAISDYLHENEHLLNSSFGATSASDTTESEDKVQTLWQDVTSNNSLADVAALHCNIQLDKEARNVFTDGTSRETILKQLPDLLAYCATDVSTTFSVFAKVWPAFRQSCPHPVTMAGVLGLGSTFLPVDQNWPLYLSSASSKFDEMSAQVTSTLKDLSKQLMESGVQAIDAHPDSEGWWKTDPWYGQLDWSPKRPKVFDADSYVPAWWKEKVANFAKPLSARHKFVPLLLQLTCDGYPVTVDSANPKKWVFVRDGEEHPLAASPLSQSMFKKHEILSEAGPLGAQSLLAIQEGNKDMDQLLRQLAEWQKEHGDRADLRLSQLDWTAVPYHDPNLSTPWWPKWYWDLYSIAEKSLEVTIRSKIAPLLLKIAWDGAPIYRSREHGWVYRVDDNHNQHKILTFSLEADKHLWHGCFSKLPHTNGDGSNVGNPFSKGFLPFFESGRLKSLHPSESGGQAAKAALEMNAQCSYWISARDRIEKQFVVWDGEAGTNMGFPPHPGSEQRGLILPQVISMGTVTRRAIEKTWLTASNAKKNRIGSELKSMVRAPEGWSIVGADVDSEELWICSVMGDAQFGMHGATAIGWMTLEGSKTEGTDLHSKTAAILGTSRNEAKVFNYSRIYGAGIRHATQLLLKANPSMPIEEALGRAKALYAATKGQTTRSSNVFGRKFWFGGTESFVFNKLEEIAMSDEPKTPALGCGITAALSKRYLPKSADRARQDFMPSRINWVVQSSGVDYLHLLIVGMDHLCRTYDISARFMLSVHDEVRYLAKDEDRFRAALALQIANLWTRAMFAYRLNMDDLPESCAFFSAVDIDRVLRKEVDDPCVTPSQPNAIPPGQSLDIHSLLQIQSTLNRRGQTGLQESISQVNASAEDEYPPYKPSLQKHRCVSEEDLLFLQAQASPYLEEVVALDRRCKRQKRSNLRSSRGVFGNTVRNYSTQRGAAAPLATTEHILQAMVLLLPRRPILSPQPRPVRKTLEHKRPRKPKSPTKFYLPGSLLRPSLYNKPMLRVKPGFKIQTTMMMQARRNARLKRLQNWDESVEICQLADIEALATYKENEFESAAEWRTYAPELITLQKSLTRSFKNKCSINSIASIVGRPWCSLQIN